MRRFTLFLLILLSLPAAAIPIAVIPPGPTSATPVTLRLNIHCAPLTAADVTRDGFTIRINATTIANPCPSPPVDFLHDVALGKLPTGEYRVNVFLADRQFTRTFIVRNAEPGPVEIAPFAVPTVPFGLQLRAVYALGCAGPNCSDVTVNVGGVNIPSSRIRGSSDGAIFFDAPAHARGFADVTITANGQTFTSKNALYFYDPTEEPDPSLWMRVLFPVLFNTAGAHGSQWVSEAAISNAGRSYVQNFNRIDTEPCIDWGCSQLLSPGGFFPFDGSGHPNGVALLVPRSEVDQLAFLLRVRNVARQAEGFGTEIPVLREDRMFADAPLTLLDVPLDPRYRVKLRIYAFDTEAFATFVDVQRGKTFSGFPLQYHRACTGLACAATPAYAEVDLPPGNEGERVNLHISQATAGSLTWAFATVTNNETQQVTIVTPDGVGGRPEVQ
ncbi:MAG TPA: hypothetical protein VNI54_17795 [Thermoanaerobaculia bacterium]|nr:hypothetical protein [Thermoanaerobaculia bacterium]